jgi:diacylglycerol kinase family enzyme
MSAISQVYIIYNPNSTGDGLVNAKSLKQSLKASNIRCTLKVTKHAGHATDLAKELASNDPHCMVISSSGDGGYHEVINGVLGSKNPRVITGVLPSGNANDHFHFVHHGDAAQRIARGRADYIDVLSVSTPDWSHYAHSYVGLGLTPHIGKELTKQRPNKLQEKWLVVKNIFAIPEVKIRVGRRVRSYTNVVFSNSGRMSKYLTLSHKASVGDGKFEITRVKSSTPFGILRHLLHASTKGVDEAPQARRYSCKALRNMHIQLDGEIYTVNSGEKILITCEPLLLRTIV